MLAKGAGIGGGKDWEFGISIWKLVYIGRVNNKVLLYSTENYSQYPMINHNGKEHEKIYILCITEPLGCIAGINKTV